MIDFKKLYILNVHNFKYLPMIGPSSKIKYPEVIPIVVEQYFINPDLIHTDFKYQ